MLKYKRHERKDFYENTPCSTVLARTLLKFMTLGVNSKQLVNYR